MKVVCQKWEESERGWGTRPDGYSLHLSEDDLRMYVQNVYAKRNGPVPDEYDRICGTPYECEIDDSDERIQKLRKSSSYGIRVFNNDYPGDGGRDGWVSRRR